MIYYDSCAIFINSQTQIKSRLVNIRLVISALQAQRLASALNGDIANVSEYALDDGQTKIKTVYRSLSEINNALKVLRTEEQECLNQLNGRITRNIDSKNLNRFGNGYY